MAGFTVVMLMLILLAAFNVYGYLNNENKLEHLSFELDEVKSAFDMRDIANQRALILMRMWNWVKKLLQPKHQKTNRLKSLTLNWSKSNSFAAMPRHQPARPTFYWHAGLGLSIRPAG